MIAIKLPSAKNVRDEMQYMYSFYAILCTLSYAPKARLCSFLFKYTKCCNYPWSECFKKYFSSATSLHSTWRMIYLPHTEKILLSLPIRTTCLLILRQNQKQNFFFSPFQFLGEMSDCHVVVQYNYRPKQKYPNQYCKKNLIRK